MRVALKAGQLWDGDGFDEAKGPVCMCGVDMVEGEGKVGERRGSREIDTSAQMLHADLSHFVTN